MESVQKMAEKLSTKFLEIRKSIPAAIDQCFVQVWDGLWKDRKAQKAFNVGEKVSSIFFSPFFLWWVGTAT